MSAAKWMVRLSALALISTFAFSSGGIASASSPTYTACATNSGVLQVEGDHGCPFGTHQVTIDAHWSCRPAVLLVLPDLRVPRATLAAGCRYHRRHGAEGHTGAKARPVLLDLLVPPALRGATGNYGCHRRNRCHRSRQGADRRYWCRRCQRCHRCDRCYWCHGATGSHRCHRCHRCNRRHWYRLA